jgi:glucosylceramidase
MIFSRKYLSMIVLLMPMFISCKSAEKNSADSPSGFELWLTNPDKSALFQKQADSKVSGNTDSAPVITVDENQTYQTMDGYGCALTGGSATLLHQMSAAERGVLLQELFGTDGSNIGISYLRISIGASDLSDHVFSYDDMPAGQTDTAMANFSLDAEQTDVIPILKEILAVNPDIKILGSPWSAPLWMKTNSSSIGGSLKPQYYAAYAKYFVKYIQGMNAEGIHIEAITVQNEPLYGGNNPSMVMQASDQASFIKNNLGPAFAAANIDTKIIIYDHNADRTDYPMTVLSDPEAKKYIDGSAFHLYGGAISALSTVHNSYPDKNIYFTEQWVGVNEVFANSLSFHIGTLVIGGAWNWCKNEIEWNLASDPALMPHTVGGCTECLGALTISGNSVTRNAAYYVMAHAAKFVRPGSVHIGSNVPESLDNVAFSTPSGKKVLIVLNSGSLPKVFKINSGGKVMTTYLNAGAVGTYVW